MTTPQLLYGPKPAACPAATNHCGDCNIYPCLIGQPTPANEPSPWRSVREAAALTGNSPKTIYGWIKRGRLQARHDGALILVNVENITGARERDRISQRVPPTPPAGYITTRQAAEQFHVNRHTIQYQARTGAIRAIRCGVWYVHPDDIDSHKKDARDGV